MTRPEQVDGFLNGLPWWVKSVAMVGFPIIVALLLLAQVLGWLPSSAVSETRTYYGGRFDIIERKQDRTIERLTIGLRVLCENSATTTSQERNCRNIQ